MTPDERQQFDQFVAERWAPARERWSRFLLLSLPKEHHHPSIAQIDLRTRQISLNYELIERKRLQGSVEVLLAHEIGHHVRYPGNLSVNARLRLLERELLPYDDYSLINLFLDLLINDYLSQWLRDQMVAIYCAFHDEVDWRKDPAYLFYLAVYEERWQLPFAQLMGPRASEFEGQYPNYRADAQLLAANIFNLGPNIYTQFLYFVSIVIRYVPPPSGKPPVSMEYWDGGCGEPSPEEWAEALQPGMREKQAVARALREGWIQKDEGERMTGALSVRRRMSGIPGVRSGRAEALPEIMAAYYRQLAETYLLRPPPQLSFGESIVPTTLEDWETGELVRDIDWLATFLQRGERLGAAQPVKRTRVAEVEGFEVPLWQPRVEIYLDVSGSMPDPKVAVNAMTLAAQILAVGALRAGGWARALIYSTDYVSYWEWCRSEIELSRFLMHYVGGGTAFPFTVLSQSVADCSHHQPIRVIITDTDFDSNYDEKPENPRIFADAARESAQLILLQHRASPTVISRYRQVGAKGIEVMAMADFPKMAADLSHALFAEQHHGAG